MKIFQSSNFHRWPWLLPLREHWALSNSSWQIPLQRSFLHRFMRLRVCGHINFFGLACHITPHWPILARFPEAFHWYERKRFGWIESDVVHVWFSMHSVPRLQVSFSLTCQTIYSPVPVHLQGTLACDKILDCCKNGLLSLSSAPLKLWKGQDVLRMYCSKQN